MPRYRMQKRGIELSLETLIYVILIALVAIVAIAIFTKTGGQILQ